MQIYSKSTKNATSPLFTKINAIPQICTSGGDVYYASRNLLIHLFYILKSLEARSIQTTHKIALFSYMHWYILMYLTEDYTLLLITTSYACTCICNYYGILFLCLFVCGVIRHLLKRQLLLW